MNILALKINISTSQFDESGNLLEFDGTPILLSGEVPRDPDVLALLETYRPGLNALYAEIIGETKVESRKTLFSIQSTRYFPVIRTEFYS